MPLGRATVMLVAALLIAIPAARALSDELSVDSVSIHLFLENAGKFSRDVTQAPVVGSWNFRPIGEGIDNEELFHSFLIKVNFSSRGEIYAAGVQASIVLYEADSGRALQTETIQGVYVGPSGQVTKAILINDHVCSPLRIDVSDNEKTISHRLEFACGE